MTVGLTWPPPRIHHVILHWSWTCKKKQKYHKDINSKNLNSRWIFYIFFTYSNISFRILWRHCAWLCAQNTCGIKKYPSHSIIFIPIHSPGSSSPKNGQVLNIIINSYSASRDNWCTATLWNRIMTVQCEGMGEVGSARYEPALLPPCPSIRVLSYSNCQEIHSRQQTGLAV